METQVEYEEKISLDQLADKMDELKKYVKKYEGRSELYEWVKEKFSQLTISYPIVVKMLVFLKVYNREVFKKYVLYSQHRERKTEDQYLELQAVYVRMLYRKIYPRRSQADIDGMYADALRTLKSELTQHKEFVEASAKKFAEKEEKMKALRAEELSALARAGKLQRPTGIVVQFED